MAPPIAALRPALRAYIVLPILIGRLKCILVELW